MGERTGERPLDVDRPAVSSPSLFKTTARIARTRAELEAAYRLVYLRYRAVGLIEPHSAEMVYSSQFGLPTSRTIITTQAGDKDEGQPGGLAVPTQVQGTVTLVGDNPIGLQLQKAFPRLVLSLRQQGRRLAEATALAVQPRSNRGSRITFTSLTAFLFEYARWAGYDDLLLAVHPDHARTYQRLFLADLTGPCRPYRYVRGNPAIACRIRLGDLEQRVSGSVRRRYLAHLVPTHRLEQPPMSEQDRMYFTQKVVQPAQSRRAA